jgi:hypothetical protein
MKSHRRGELNMVGVQEQTISGEMKLEAIQKRGGRGKKRREGTSA